MSTGSPVPIVLRSGPGPRCLSAAEPLLDGLPPVGLGSRALAGLDGLLVVLLGVVGDFCFLAGRLAAGHALEDDRQLAGLEDAAFLALAAVLQVGRLPVHPAAGDPLLDADLDLLGRRHALLALVAVQLGRFPGLLALEAPGGVLHRGEVAGRAGLLFALLDQVRSPGGKGHGGRGEQGERDLERSHEILVLLDYLWNTFRAVSVAIP